MSPAPLRLLTLGTLRIRSADTQVPDYARHRRRLALLAVLAAAGSEGVSRDRLLALFWPESDGDHARGALNQLVYQLRRDFGEAVLPNAARLAINPVRISADVTDFKAAVAEHRWSQAAELYAGPFLDGFFLGDAPEFDRWVEEERDRLRRAARDTLGQLVVEAPERAALWWRRLAELDPYDGRAALGLMEAMVAEGDRTAAMRHARLYADRLREDLEAEPEPAVMRYAEGLRDTATLAERPLPVPPPALVSPPPLEPTAPSTASGIASVPAPSPRAPASIPWRWVAVGVVIAGLATAARPPKAPSAGANEPRILVARFENATGDTTLDAAGQLIADWLSDRIARADVARVVDLRTARTAERSVPADSTMSAGSRRAALALEVGAGRVLSGSYRLVGDTLLADAQLVEEPGGRVIGRIDRIAVPASNPSAAADALAERALGGLGLLDDDRKGTLAAATRQAPRYAAYRAFAEGMDLLVQGKATDAVARFAESRALDTTFVQPLLWMADAYQQGSELPKADSVLRLADRQRDALGSIDRAMLDYMRADVRGDRAAALRAARLLGQLAPGSEVDFILASEALRGQRPREALVSLTRVDPEHGFLKGWPGYWGWPMQCWLLLGQPDSALRVAEEGFKRHPTSRQALLHVILVRAATGDTASLGPLLVQADALPPEDGLPTSRILRAAAAQLAGNGFSKEASVISERGIAMLNTIDPAPAGDYDRLTLAEFLYLEGRYSAAAPIVKRMAVRLPDDLRWKGLRALVAAHQGDSVTALRIDRDLASDPRPVGYASRAFWRARIHAALGHRTETLGLLGATLAANGGDIDLTAIRIAPDFAPYRADSVFTRLIAARD